ncbi:MAG: hypothetical protein ACRD2C_13065 [Acidimicrobiales bacterium]
MSAAADRRAALTGAKLRALVADRWGEGERRPAVFGPGAALMATAGLAEAEPVPPSGQPDATPVVAGAEPAEAWLYLADQAEHGLGAVLVWADRHGVSRLHLLADGSSDDRPGQLARQAAYFTTPAVDVWTIDGRATTAARAAPLPERVSAAPRSELVDLLTDAGLEVVAEGGIVRGEINGLEVARIVHHESTAGVPLDEPLLEVGVGAADRELTAMLHGELSPVDQLDRAGLVVRRHRQADAPHHPLNQLVAERWLRAVLCRAPEAVGLARLRPAETVRPRANLRERGIAVAVGELASPRSAGTEPIADPGRTAASTAGTVPIAEPGRMAAGTASTGGTVPIAEPGRTTAGAVSTDGTELSAGAGTASMAGAGTVVVACSVGVDVDLVPAAADARGALDPEAELWLVVPERDDHPTTRHLAAHLRMPARVVTVPDAWRAGL